MSILDICKSAKSASIYMAGLSTAVKNQALSQIAKSLQSNSEKILQANRQDMEQAEKDNLGAALLKRLKFDENKLATVITGIESLIEVADPVGDTLAATELDSGLELYKVSCPLGVVGVIFESRPDALVQISTLCLKSGNSVLLKGGSEADKTNTALADVITEAGKKAGLPDGWLGLLHSREDVAQMLGMDEYIDLLIPRGSNEFVRHIMNNTNIPVLGHADGICHVYIDSDADIDMAAAIALDSKCQYVAVCNAAETLLVDEKTADRFLPKIKAKFDEKNVEILGCEKTRKIIDAKPAAEKDWATEYLDYVIAVKMVGGIDEAISHINTYGSGHTDAIVTAEKQKAAKFMDMVDSADVFWNCSTRFSDGYRYGLGAEVGISTNKIHARGPVGMEGLLTYKWKMIGSGQIVEDYSKGQKQFSHKKLDKKFKI